MEGLPTSILPSEAYFAYVASSFRLAEIYVPFVDPTEAGNAESRSALGVAVSTRARPRDKKGHGLRTTCQSRPLGAERESAVPVDHQSTGPRLSQSPCQPRPSVRM